MGGGGCPAWGCASPEDWTPFPSEHRGTAHAPFPWRSPGVGGTAPRLPASVPPAAAEVVGSTAALPLSSRGGWARPSRVRGGRGEGGGGDGQKCQEQFVLRSSFPLDPHFAGVHSATMPN